MYKSNIYLLGMPRSGTSWLSQIFDSCPETRFRLSPLFSYAFKNRLNEKSSREEWEAVFIGAYGAKNTFMEQTERRSAGQYPSFSQKVPVPPFLVIKDTRFHNLTPRMLELFPDVKLVAIIRHPCGAINSWLNAPREFPADADPLLEWRTGRCRKAGYGEFWGFDDWKNTTRMYTELADVFPNNVIIQRYEHLVQDCVSETKRLFDFCGLSYTDQTANFLKECHLKHVDNEYAVYKDPSVKDKWQAELMPEIRDAIIEELTGTELEVFVT